MKQNRNILLIYPEVPGNTYWSFKYALKFIRKKSAMPPLGLITVAALIPDRYNLKLVDMNIAPLTEKDIEWADMVFISAMIVQQASARVVLDRCRRRHKKVVLGGPWANSNREEIPGVDHFILGEVEETLSDILADLENRTARHVYTPASHPDMTRSPVPRFDLLDMDAYGSMSVQYSRGCPFHCEFCDIWTAYGNKPRLKSTIGILSEIQTLYTLGWRGAIFIVDDNFIGNKKRVKTEFLPALKAWQQTHGHPFHFFTEASINIADDEELLGAMREAGFNEVFIGIETPDPAGLAETGKTQNLKTDMSQSIRAIQRHGIEVMAGFIVGFDNDPDDIFDRQISFIQQNAIPKAMIGLLTALPGTRLHQRLKSEGRLLAATTGNNTHNPTTNFKTVMDANRIREGYQKILENLYDLRMKNYFERCNRLFDAMEFKEFFHRRIRLKEIKIFLKSIFRQPFTPYGLQYLKFVLRNLIRHRDIFAEVITFSITGHHFHAITREMLKVERISSALDEKFQTFTKLVNRYSQTLMNDSRYNISRAARLWKKRVKILRQMRAKIDRTHVDFREELIQKYINLSGQMREIIARFEQKALFHG